MRKAFLSVAICCLAGSLFAQVMTPELLWSLGRVSGETITPDGKSVIFGVTHYDITTGASERNLFMTNQSITAPVQITFEKGSEHSVMILPGGKMGYMYKGQIWQADWDGKNAIQLTSYEGGLNNVRFSPDGKYILFSKDVKMEKVMSSEIYPDLSNSNVRVINDLNYRHWDTWEDGSYSHLFYAEWNAGKITNEKDIMAGQKYDSPQMPFGGVEDMLWSNDSRKIIYVVKQKSGREYAVSTNTDILIYDLATGQVTNLTQGFPGYDTSPAISPDGSKIVWLSMEREGYEADKNRLFFAELSNPVPVEMNSGFDETVESFRWSSDGKNLYFITATNGTRQLFRFNVESFLMKVDGGRKANPVTQITKGDFDITSVIGEMNGGLVVIRTDMNHAAEIFSVDPESGEMVQVTNINKRYYDGVKLSKVERKFVRTTDGKEMLVWFIYPPDFDPAKKYPTLLYCQGGPQSALTQFYSFRWNFQLMAANGYIVVAPNRRGMPGHGVEWNADISKDWGGQPIRDYYSAIDYAATLHFVDTSRMGAVGASYGGYSVFMMAGTHEKRFKTFIAHDGLFNLESFYGTTEEMWFANWDLGGPYWERGIQDSSYEHFNPIRFVSNWDTPIMIIHGGRDYRVTEDQGMQAFNAAQLKGLKSRFIYLPDQNHWVLTCHDALVWQREFFKWLEETL